MSDRKSSTDDSDDDDKLLSDTRLIADQEARNGLLQFDHLNLLTRRFAPVGRFEATPAFVCDLNRIAIQGIRRSAGVLRQCSIEITHTSHVPPPYQEVPRHMVEMCAYANTYWDQEMDAVERAIHLAAYFMWRVNWIHPFRDGNGRTSRAMSYLALGIGLRRELIGTPTIADQIVDNRGPYYDALDEADAAWRDGEIDLTAMESLIVTLLEKQLSSSGFAE